MSCANPDAFSYMWCPNSFACSILPPIHYFAPPTACEATFFTVEKAFLPIESMLLPRLLTPDLTVPTALEAKFFALSTTLDAVLVTFESALVAVSARLCAMPERLQKCGVWPCFTSEWKVCTAFHRWLDPRDAR